MLLDTVSCTTVNAFHCVFLSIIVDWILSVLAHEHIRRTRIVNAETRLRFAKSIGSL